MHRSRLFADAAGWSPHTDSYEQKIRKGPFDIIFLTRGDCEAAGVESQSVIDHKRFYDTSGSFSAQHFEAQDMMSGW